MSTFAGRVPGPFRRSQRLRARTYWRPRNSSSASFSRVACCFQAGSDAVIQMAPIPMTTRSTTITNPDASDCDDRMDVLSSVTHHMNRLLRVFPLISGFGLLLTLGAAACDKVPLLAPTGSIINLTVTTDAAALNSTVEIIAVVIENGTASSTGTGTASTGSSTAGAGTPVQNGTVVSFTTSIGTIEPAEARTSNGRVNVRLKTTSESGTATITAFSGGAKATAQIKIGAANAKTLSLTASPQNLPATGGTSTVTARVDDSNGNGIVGVPVLFGTDKGSLSATSVVTGAAGTAFTTLTTTSAAKVSAVAGALTKVEVAIGVATRTALTLTVPTSAQVISTAVPITVSTGTSGALTNVVINYGDGQTKSLGLLSGSQTVTHFYSSTGIFDISVSGLDPDGVPATQFAQIAVTGLTVSLTGPSTTPVVRGTSVTFTATVSPNTASIERYDWDFGDGTNGTSSSGSITHVFQNGSVVGSLPTGVATVVTVRVTVYPAFGPSYTTTIQVPIGA